MPVTINASTSSGLISSADTSGTIELQSNGTTKLTVSSSGVNIGQMNGGAITSGTAVASTSGTSIDFTGIPSWVKRITIMLNGVSTGGTSNYIVQISSGAGSLNTGYASSCAYAGGVNQAAGATQTGGFVILNEVLTTTAAAGTVTLNLFGNNTWISNGTLMYNSTTPSAFTATSTGVRALGGTLDRVRITSVSSDTFDAGSINILYEG